MQPSLFGLVSSLAALLPAWKDKKKKGGLEEEYEKHEL